MKRSKLLLIAFLSAVVMSASAQDNDTQEKETKRKYNYGTHHNFQVDLGINNWLEDDEFPNDNNALYAVRPWGSWYISLNAINDTHVGGPLHVEWGVGVSWYNFKFENEAVRLSEGPGIVEFTEVPSDIDTKKSKLTASYLNVSLVPVLQFGENHHRGHRHGQRWGDWHSFSDRGGLRIGAGAYAGYKIASYTKTVTDDRNREKDHDGFFLNNLRYGVRVQVGFGGVDLFANYDLNEIFVEDKGPKLNAFSFGITI
jgi:opacity protein-like surface antigen